MNNLTLYMFFIYICFTIFLWLTMKQFNKNMINKEINSFTMNFSSVIATFIDNFTLFNVVFLVFLFCTFKSNSLILSLYYVLHIPLVSLLFVIYTFYKRNIFKNPRNKSLRFNNFFSFIKNNKSICFFEYNYKTNSFWISESIYSLIGLENNKPNREYCKDIILIHTQGEEEYVFSLNHRKNNSEKWFKINFNKDSKMLIGSLIDVTKEELDKKELEDSYKTDVLTGLLNRRQLDAVIEKAIEKTQKNRYIAFYFIDIDFFKKINDTYGHGVGDSILSTFGQSIVDPDLEAFYVRVAGDEFAIIISNVDSAETAKRYGTHHISKVSSVDFYAEKEKISVTFSCGCALFGKDTIEKQELMKFADHALYEAKQLGRNRLVMFDKKKYEKQNQQSQLMLNIDNILDQKLFTIMYQPIISIRNNDIVGYEAICCPSSVLNMSFQEFMEGIRKMNKTESFNRIFLEILKKNIEDYNITSDKFFTIRQSEEPNTYQHINTNLFYIIDEQYNTSGNDLELLTKRLLEKGKSILYDNYKLDFFNDMFIFNTGIKLIRYSKKITENISKNSFKQILLRNNIKNIHQIDVEIIAEANTKEDFHSLINLNVDYLQGSYLMPLSNIIETVIPEYIKKEIANAYYAKKTL